MTRQSPKRLHKNPACSTHTNIGLKPKRKHLVLYKAPKEGQSRTQIVYCPLSFGYCTLFTAYSLYIYVCICATSLFSLSFFLSLSIYICSDILVNLCIYTYDIHSNRRISKCIHIFIYIADTHIYIYTYILQYM